MPNILISLFVILIFLFLSFFYTFRNTKNIYNPLENIQNVLSGGSNFESSGDIFNDITSLASNVRSKLETVLPGVQEKYLINLLNSNSYSDETEEKTILETLNFPFNLFSVLIMQVSPTQRLYDEYNSSDYDRFKYGFYTVVKETFSEYFNCYVLPTEHDMLYVIFNFQDMEATEKIDNTIKQLSEYLKNDVDYINFSVGKSGIYKDISGLKQAHSEAMDDFKELDINETQIMLKKTSDLSTSISLDKQTQNNLTSALLSVNSEKVYEIIDSTVSKYKTASAKQKKELYNSILSIVLKVIRLKKIPYKDDKLEFEIIYDCLNQPPKNAYNEMMIIVDYLLNTLSSQKRENTVDYDKIIEYINNNFTFQDLSLKFLADYFDVNSSNLSAALKQRLSVGFHTYLTELRIEKAKKLLLTTKKNAQDIGTACGFSSINTFFRVFKENTGITPSEFRKQQDI